MLKNPEPYFKNFICLSICLLFLSVTFIFVSSSYFNDSINTQIQNAALLKAFYYPEWGQQPNQKKSILTQSITPYNISIDSQGIKSVKSDQIIKFDLEYQFTNMSFYQGNSGILKFLNKWRVSKKQAPSTDLSINSLNLVSQKIFNYNYYAPEVRSFTLMYNKLKKSLENQTIPYFYSEYLFQYFYKDKTEVIDKVLSKLKLNSIKTEQIYSNFNFGFSNSGSLLKWISLALLEDYHNSSVYEDIRSQFGLSQNQIKFLVDEKSTLKHLIQALNGTIKYKLWSRVLNIECKGAFCSNEQLSGSQIVSGFLTKNALFSSLSLDLSTMGMNQTYLKQIQYLTFCKNNPQIICLQEKSAIQFFSKHYFADFTTVKFFFDNSNNPSFIEQKMSLTNGTGLSILRYINYLKDNIFKIQADQSSFKWAYTNYEYINQAINQFQKLLHIQLYSRAFYQNFIINQKNNCSQYYLSFQKYQSVACSLSNLDFKSLNAVRTYVKAYFFYNRTDFAVTLKMNNDIIYEFLKGSNSLFANQMSQIKKDFQENYQCIQGCSSKQLMIREWGSMQILKNLPSKYFVSKQISILSWDQENVLSKFLPQISNVIPGLTFTYEESKKLLSFNEKNSIVNLYELLKIKKDNSLQNMVQYVQKSVLGICFGGMFSMKKISNLVDGYSDKNLEQRKHRNILQGGTPWITQNVSLFPLDNTFQTKYQNQINLFDEINTGIYHQQKTRSMRQIKGKNVSNSIYTIVQTEDSNILQIFETNKSIISNNIYGFHPQIKQNQPFQVYLPMSYGTVSLIDQQSVDLSGINCYKYKIISKVNPIKIGVEEQNNRQIKLQQAWLIVEPITGLTLSFSIKMQVSTFPLYGSTITKGKQIPIYANQFNFQRTDLENIRQITDNKIAMKICQLVGVIIVFISLLSLIILFVVGIILRRKRSHKKQSLLQSEVIDSIAN